MSVTSLAKPLTAKLLESVNVRKTRPILAPGGQQDILYLSDYVVEHYNIPRELSDYIWSLNAAFPQGAGCFLDYLVRRMIAEIFSLTTVYDVRVEGILGSHFAVRNGEPFSEIKEQINIAYEKYQNLDLKSTDILEDIYTVSVCHNMSFRRHDHESHQRLLCVVRSAADFTPLFYEIKRTMYKNASCVLINPKLSTTGISADADLIIDDAVTDIKAVKQCSSREWYQQLAYASLAQTHGILINKVSILNVLHCTIKTIDISNWLPKYASLFLDLLCKKHSVFWPFKHTPPNQCSRYLKTEESTPLIDYFEPNIEYYGAYYRRIIKRGTDALQIKNGIAVKLAEKREINSPQVGNGIEVELVNKRKATVQTRIHETKAQRRARECAEAYEAHKIGINKQYPHEYVL